MAKEFEFHIKTNNSDKALKALKEQVQKALEECGQVAESHSLHRKSVMRSSISEI